VAEATVRAAVIQAGLAAPELPLIAGGKSFGGRMTSGAAARSLPGVRGLAFLGFPLHPPGRPGTRRADHLETVAEQSGCSLSDLALRFSLSHPAVSTVSAGISSRAHLDANLAALERGPLSADVLRVLSGHEWLC